MFSLKATGGSTVDIAAFTYAHMVKRRRLHLGARTYRGLIPRTIEFVEACGLEIVYGTSTPVYFPKEDIIGMPEFSTYLVKQPWRPYRKYAAHMLHELVHATAHNKRLGRPLGAEFGDQIYCREELVAELGSAFLSWDLGLVRRPTLINSRYLNGWLSALPNARVELEMALGRANQATAFLLALARRRGHYGA